MLSGLNGAAASVTERLLYPELFQLLGVIAAIVIPLALLACAAFFFFRMSATVQRKAAILAMREDQTPGNKILIGNIDGRSGGAASRKVMTALEERLPEFNFGSDFYMGAAPLTLEATDFALTRSDYKELTTVFEESGADLIIWGDTNFGPHSTRLCFATPATLRESSSSGFFSMDIARSPSDWTEEDFLSIAYVAGKRLRPSLGKPADFRAERLQPILQAMSTLLEAENKLEGQAGKELEDDFAAGALHVGETLNNKDWLEKSIAFRTKSLAKMSPGKDPIRWSQAKIDLGRAMCLVCEHKFEPAKLQEAMTHIREGIDNTKSDARMQLAEAGFASLQKAERMLADRRRFSIRWSV